MAGCSKQKKSNIFTPFDKAAVKPLVIWAHSDVQPRAEQEKSDYITAVNDIKENFGAIPLALFAGDIVQRQNLKEMCQWFIDIRKKASIPVWLEIAGNHDWRALDLYKQYIKKPLSYTKETGNILFIMMSNENSKRYTYISDETFSWWKEKVINNQDKIIITVTHGCLKQSGLFASNWDRLCIQNSERFANVLKKNKIDIWISGHSHFPAWFPRMEYQNNELNKILFIDIGAIRKDFMTSIESCFLYFIPGKDKALIKRRNHESKEFNDEYDRVKKLSHPYIPKNGKLQKNNYLL